MRQAGQPGQPGEATQGPGGDSAHPEDGRQPRNLRCQKATQLTDNVDGYRDQSHVKRALQGTHLITGQRVLENSLEILGKFETPNDPPERLARVLIVEIGVPVDIIGGGVPMYTHELEKVHQRLPHPRLGAPGQVGQSVDCVVGGVEIDSQSLQELL